jgi:hypothetical protein
MASRRKYGYYLKGNKIAIIEEGTGSGICSLSGYSSQTTCESAGGTWTENAISTNDGEYRSPVATVADGLEIQYAYSPTYRVYSNAAIEVNKFYINGWTVIDGYLTFLRTNNNIGNTNWTSSPENVVSSASTGQGDTGGQSLDYIVVRGSERWNGLHRVQTAGTQGTLKTYTKVSDTLSYWESKVVDFNVSEQFFDGGSGIRYADYFSAGDYVFVGGETEDVENQGLHKVGSVTTSTTAVESFVTLDTSYAYYASNQTGAVLSNEHSFTPAFTAADGSSAAVTTNLYKAHRDFCYILTDVNVLNDESDTIDLNRYQANAVVYYLKAKMAEDAGDMEKREFFLREFKRQLEKGVSALKRGPYIVQGFKEMR